MINFEGLFDKGENWQKLFQINNVQFKCIVYSAGGHNS